MVLECLTNVFALHPSQISASTPVADFGLDSQKGTELANLIFDRSRVRVPYIFIATDDHSAVDIANFVKSRQEMGISSDGVDASLIPKLPLIRFMEELLLDDSVVEYNEVHLLVTGPKIKPCMVQTSIQYLLHAYPELRATFHPDIDITGKTILRKEITGNEDAILQIEIKEGDLDDTSRVRNLQYEAFRVVILPRSLNIEIILMFCPLIFDGYSIAGIVEEVGRFITYGSTNLEIHVHSKSQNEIRQPVMENFFMFEEEKVKRFWRSELKRQKCQFIVNSKDNENGLHWKSMQISDHVMGALQNILTQNNISVYQAMCCFIQIGLGIVTKASEVTILVQTDMRPMMGFHDFGIGIGVYSNIIPSIADFSNQMNVSLHDYLLQSTQKFDSIQMMGVLPFHLIKELPEYDESKHQNVLCKFIDENNIIGSRSSVQVQSYRPGFTSIARVEITIVSASQHMTLYLKSEESMFSTTLALSNCICHLLDIYIHHSEFSLHETVKLTSDAKFFEHTNGKLYKKKTMILKNVVEPKVINFKGNQNRLQLGSLHLPLGDISSVNINEDCHALVIETKKKTIRLYAENVKTCEVWANYINRKIDRHLRGWKWRGSQSSLFKSEQGEITEAESTYL